MTGRPSVIRTRPGGAVPPEERRVKPRRPAGKDTFTLACERTAQVMRDFDHVFVAFSGGKDSMAVLEVALHVAHSDPAFARHLPLRAVFWDEEAIPFESEDYVRRTANRPDVALEWMCVPIQHRNACSRTSPYWWPWAPEARDLWVRPLPPEAITVLDGFPVEPPAHRLTIPDSNGLTVTPDMGNCAMLMGLRAQESMVRSLAVSGGGVGAADTWIVNYVGATSRSNLWKAYPIYDWTHEDVWTGVRLLGWDHNAAYDRFEMAGVGVPSQRCAAAFGEQPLAKLYLFAQCFPEVWERMVDRVPGVGSAFRYGAGELYSYRGRPVKPDGMTWPDFMLHYIDQHDPVGRGKTTWRIRGMLRTHYHKTTGPILDTVRHPETGLDWNWLLLVAMRGDFKERAQPHMRIQLLADGTRPLSFWANYTRRYRELLAEGITPAALGYPRSVLPPVQAVVPGYAREVLAS